MTQSGFAVGGVGWWGGVGGGGGVGWDNDVHVPVHTQARQAHHTRAARSSLLSIETHCPQENLSMIRVR